jgi:8-oxo-dGTP pyrophosphatase MutT (NUDIX family)
MAMSAYLRDLRAKVGNELLVLPAVAVFVVDEPARQVLLCRNAGQTHWEAIGGMVEPHEHPLTAAQRELQEETGLLVGVEDLVLLGSVGGPQYLVTYPNGHEVSYVTSVYRVVLSGVQPVADGDEITAVGWHPLADLANCSEGTEPNEMVSSIQSTGVPDPACRSERTPWRDSKRSGDGARQQGRVTDLADLDSAKPDPELYGLFVRSLLAEFGARL